MAQSSRAPRTYLLFLLLAMTLSSPSFSLPAPSPGQPIQPPLPLVLPATTQDFLTVAPTAVPVDPCLITIDRYASICFHDYANPPLGLPASLEVFLSKLSDKILGELRTHGGRKGVLTHFDFSRQQGGSVINFAVDWEPMQEGKGLELTYDQLLNLAGDLNEWRSRWGRKSKVLGCEFTWAKAAQESPPVPVVARGRWWATPAGAGGLGTVGGDGGGNVTLEEGGSAKGKPAVVGTSRKRSRGNLSGDFGCEDPRTYLVLLTRPGSGSGKERAGWLNPVRQHFEESFHSGSVTRELGSSVDCSCVTQREVQTVRDSRHRRISE